jgi:hypothetical protein
MGNIGLLNQGVSLFSWAKSTSDPIMVLLQSEEKEIANSAQPSHLAQPVKKEVS